MTVGTQLIIEQHIDWIENNEFEKIYQLHDTFDRAEFTQIMLSVGINPLEYMSYVPENYLNGSKITSIELPNNIEKIEPAAFYQCSELSDVKLPNGLTHISYGAFAECPKLENITLPPSLLYIKSDAFAESGLKHVILPDNVHISQHAFEECKQLETVVLGEGITRVPNGCFGKCESLKSVKLNSDLIKIRSYAFKQCYNLKELFIPESVQNIEVSAFYGIEDNITLVCTENSAAHKYASLFDMNFKLI